MTDDVNYPVKGYYEVRVVADGEFHGCKGVGFTMFKPGAKEAELAWISRHTDAKSAGQDDVYFFSQFDMMFSLPEVGQLIEWFITHRPTSHVEVFPAVAHENAMSISCMAVGGGDDFLMFDESEDYTLPFKVWGYYNLRTYWETMPASSVAADDVPVGVPAGLPESDWF